MLNAIRIKKEVLLGTCIVASGFLSSYGVKEKDCLPERTKHLVCDSVRKQFTDSSGEVSKTQFSIIVSSLAKQKKLSKKDFWNNYYKCMSCEYDEIFKHPQGGVLVQMVWVNYRRLPEMLFSAEEYGLDIMQKDPFTDETIFEYIDRRLAGDTKENELPLSTKHVENFKWFRKELKKYRYNN